jgi:prepilin-type N-terminal cleavage/methylation domain-containing protein
VCVEGAALGIRFNALGKMERAAVAAFARDEYDKLIFQQPNSYVSKNAQTDPEQWQDALRELIAGDPKRIEAIVEAANRTPPQSDGFTLIELSIVLVIIGLIVGSVLVGRSLIQAAGVRATITQIEKYNTAVNAFRTKYNNDLPGDMNAADAAQFGFVARGPFAGEGDGNGIIEGVWANSPGENCICEGTGETTMFWVDLSTSNLIDGGFNTASPTVLPGTITGEALNSWFPQAKLGGNNYIYAYSGGSWSGTSVTTGINYFGIAAVSSISAGYEFYTAPGMTVQQAYNIDTKIDDGLPQSGNVTAQYVNYTAAWASSIYVGAPNTSTTPGFFLHLL